MAVFKVQSNKQEKIIKVKNIKVGDKAPNFSLPDQSGKIHSLKDEKGKWIVLYFYPKDDTPGCTIEACQFRDSIKDFLARNIQVFGISKDSVNSHTKFADKYVLPFPLLADPEMTMSIDYSALSEKKFLGKVHHSVMRITFLINPEGKIAKVYEAVNPLDHAKEILEDVEAFTEA